MPPQRNLIEAAELIHLDEISSVQKPSVYDYDKHDSNWNEFQQSDEYRQMKRDSFHPTKGPNMENIQKISDKHKEMHPMGFHVQTAHAELLSHEASPKYNALTNKEKIDKRTDTMRDHYTDFLRTTRDHPVHGGLNPTENADIFFNKVRSKLDRESDF